MMGLFAISFSACKKRTKETGIRKINGATIVQVMTLLNKDFIRWVVIAFIIAAPFGYYIMYKWLQNFAYKTQLSWEIFASAGLIAIGIALITISWQSFRAATKNPVESLRFE
jgi:putative ABC transport system permease protein